MALTLCQKRFLNPVVVVIVAAAAAVVVVVVVVVKKLKISCSLDHTILFKFQ